MKKRIYLLPIAIITCSLLGNALEIMTQNDVGQSPFNRVELGSPIILDDSLLVNPRLFHIDDSLLLEVYPAAQVRPLHAPPQQNDEFSHLQMLQFTANDTEKPFYLIITTPTLFTNLKKEIIQYAEDVHAIYGYGIYLEVVSNATAQQLKSLIVSYQNNLCGVISIGDFPACMFEIANDYADLGEESYGYRKWPCDLYFMDLDGAWDDTDNNGIYDTHTGHVGPDIYFARLSTHGMLSMGNETDLYRRQLKKSHSFWWNSSFHSQNTALGYINRDWVGNIGANELGLVFPSENTFICQDGLDTCFSTNDYLSRLVQSDYGFTHLAAHSSSIHHEFGDSKISLLQIHSL